MIKLLIAYDHLDLDLGLYFENCYADVNDTALASGNFEILNLNSDSSHVNAVTDLIETFKEKPFIFIAYAHGNQDAILISNEKIVHAENAYFFGSSFVYTCACETAQVLGKALDQNNCKVFIGYEDNYYTVTDFDPIFMECANYGIKLFLGGTKTVKEIYNEMKAFYTNKALELTKKNALAAAFLLDNGNTLVMYPEEADYILADFQ